MTEIRSHIYDIVICIFDAKQHNCVVRIINSTTENEAQLQPDKSKQIPLKVFWV